MPNFSDGSLSQALNDRKGPFFAFLAKFNVKASSQNPASGAQRTNAESVCDKLDFLGVYGHRSIFVKLRLFTELRFLPLKTNSVKDA